MSVHDKKIDLTTCPHCGKNDQKWIPDSLAQHCSCGFVRVETSTGWKPGASIQKWLNDTYLKDWKIPDLHKK